MDHRISDTTVLYFGDADQAPDEIGMSFALADLPAAWGRIEPTAVQLQGLDLRVEVQTEQGPHTLILANDTQIIANSFHNFAEVVIIGLDDEGEFALETVLPWPAQS